MREILAVRKVLQSFAPKLAGLCVKWYTDNQNVARIISVGSRKSGLQSEAKRIFEICVHDLCFVFVFVSFPKLNVVISLDLKV